MGEPPVNASMGPVFVLYNIIDLYKHGRKPHGRNLAKLHQVQLNIKFN